MYCMQPVILFILLVRHCLSDCDDLPSSTDDLKITVTSDGNDWEVTCSEDYWVFVNNVRSVDDVNITELDLTNKITGTCSSGSNVPDVFDYLGSDREWYCQPGCLPIHGDEWDVTYPEEVFSRESWSPPVRPVTKTVTVACADGYGRTVGDSGTTETSCSSAGWTVERSSLITCQRGCSDITADVLYAETTATASSTDGRAPFTTGDIVPFNCKSGYVLVGYQTLTCDSMGDWNSPLPQCVVVSSASYLLPEYSIFLLIIINYILS